MKRFITLLLLIATTLNVMAQDPANSRRPVWFGLDAGATWQASDMKARPGIGFGVTMSRYSKMDKNGPLYFGWRVRILEGRNYGYNYHRLYGLSGDPVLSQGATNYATPSGNNDGSVFSNYKMRYDEFDYDLIVGSNGLRKRGILLYAFGGLGLTYWKTTTDQLDETGQRYDYSLVDQTGTSDIFRGDLTSLWDNDYETVANGSKAKGQWDFMPSAGFGFGWQYRNTFAIGFEHRTTFALNDLIDGVNHDYTGAATPNNDIYNYDGVFLRWTFGQSSNSSNTAHTTPPANPNTYTPNPTYTPPPTTTVVTPPTNNPPVNNQPTNPQYNPPTNTGYPPQVRFTTPSVEPYTATVVNQQLVVRVDNVASANNINLVINNQVSYNFSYNASTSTMVFSHTLQNGVNTYQVTATNPYGSATDVQTIYYNNVVTNTTPNQLPPQVTITNPSIDPYASPTATTNVSATVLNVTSVAGVQVRRNGSPVTNFSFDPNTHQVNFVASLQNGSNLYEVIGTNSIGSASDQTTITYNPVAPIQPPVVTITAPATCPIAVKASTYTVQANITNVTIASQVSIVFNNQPVTVFNFTNMGSYAQVSFPVTLNSGLNPFTITGTNAGGSNSKTCEINYKVTTTPTVQPPVVTITAPASCPLLVKINTYTVQAQVTNVTMANQVTIVFNNQQVNTFNFVNMGSYAQVSFPVTLVSGMNPFTITGTNAAGTNSKTCEINYRVANEPVVLPPVVNITVPSVNPFITSTSPSTVTAEVLNVTQSGQIVVSTLQNSNIPFTFNAGTHLVTFSAALLSGANVFTITATNTAGTASDNTTIKYVGTATGTPTTPTNGPATPPVTTRPTTIAPSINLLSPSTQNSNATVQTLPVTMTVLGASSISEISIRVNNVRVMNGAYDANTHVLSFNANLALGSNTITVQVTTPGGTANTTLTVTYANTRSGAETSTPKTTTEKEGEKKEETKAPTNTPRTTSTSTSTSPAPTQETKPSTTTPTTAPSRPR